MDLTLLQSLLARARDVRVACVGDIMLDRYVYGEVTRVSPEAPIPVLAQRSRKTMLGAVGNVARNVAALGATATLTALIGDDEGGREIADIAVEASGVEAVLVTDATRPTTIKTRFVAGGQQLLRLDEETTQHAGLVAEERLAKAAGTSVVKAHAVVLSDYGKGALTARVQAEVLAAAQAAGRPVIVDPKGRDFTAYGAVDLIKPNAGELAGATGLPTGTDAEVSAALAAALAGSQAKAVLVTRAGQGVSWMERGGPVRHARAVAKEVFDVSGAGDTVLAALGVALGAGATLEQAVRLAVLASGVVVQKVGTAVATPADLVDAELSQHLASAEGKVVTLDRARESVDRWRERGLRIGFTNGCFDVLHRGHVAYLTQARGWCDRLVVGLNSDRSVRALKGEGRPVHDLESRAVVLGGLAPVDLVAPFDEDTPIRLIEALRPDVLIKGADYAEADVVGGKLVKSWGGEVRLADIVDGQSSTAAIGRMREAKWSSR